MTARTSRRTRWTPRAARPPRAATRRSSPATRAAAPPAGPTRAARAARTTSRTVRAARRRATRAPRADEPDRTARSSWDEGVVDPLIVVFGLGVGVLVGLTGMGGGSLMTPLLILVKRQARGRRCGGKGVHGHEKQRRRIGT